MDATTEKQALGKPLQLISVEDKNGTHKLHLNSSVLNEIFDQVGQKAVSVISVIGPPRNGKSFLIGYFVRCLEVIEKGEIDLIVWQTPERPLTAFQFGARNEAATNGIWIWSRPFFLYNDEDTEVGVILMDCQGVSPQAGMEALVNFTMLVSSQVILNFSRDVSEEFCEIFHTCTDYGERLKHQIEADDLLPFQSITVIIRDWMETPKFPQGPIGGRIFLDSKLKSKYGRITKAENMLKSLKSCSQSFSGFLMPNAGDKSKRVEFTGAVEELNPSFAKKIEQLIRSIVMDDKITVKKMLGRDLSGSSVKYNISRYMTLFSSQILPNAESILSVTKEIAKHFAIMIAMAKYRSVLGRHKQDNIPYFNAEAMNVAHKIAKYRALEALRHQTALLSLRELKDDLNSQLNKTISAIQEENRQKREAFTNEQMDGVADLLKNYQNQLFHIFGKNFMLYKQADMQSKLQPLITKLVEDFLSQFPADSNESKNELRKAVLQHLNALMTSFLSKNENNCEVVKKTMNNVIQDQLSEFKHEIQDYFNANKYETNFKKMENCFAQLSKVQQDSFYTKIDPNYRTFYPDQEVYFLQEMKRVFDVHKTVHLQRLESEEQIMEERIQTYLAKFRTEMKKNLDTGGPANPLIKALYQEKSESIKKKYKKKSIFSFTSAKYKEYEAKLEQKLRQVHNEIISAAEENQKIVERQYDNAIDASMCKLNTQIQAFRTTYASGFLSDDQFDQEIQKIKQSVMSVYNNHQIKQPCQETDIKARIDLEKRIHEKFHALRINNNQQKLLATNIAQDHVNTFVKEYEKYIRNELDQCKTMGNLEYWHKHHMENTTSKLKNLNSTWDSEFVEPYLDHLCDSIQHVYDQVKAEFETSAKDHAINMKSTLAYGQLYYDEEMKKHFQNNVFINPDELINYHDKSKAEVIKRIKSNDCLTPWQIEDLEKALNKLFPIFKKKNYMNAANSEGSTIPPAIGIDLGTTYCCVGAYYQGKVHIIPHLAQGNDTTTPSYVAFDTDGGTTIGKPAKENAFRNPEFTIYDAKRIIGRKYTDSVLQEDMKFWPFTVEEHEGVPKIVVDNKHYCPEEISSKLLASLKSMTESYFKLPQGSIKKAVITVPAYFSDGQRQATIDAGELAGLEVLQILNEPTAAAISYIMERLDSNAKNILVYDLGGGTFDVAILRMNEGEIKVLGVNGDTHLGGEDFDRNLMQYCVRRFEEETQVNLFKAKDSSIKVERDECRRRLRRLQTYCENAKKDLTTARRKEIVIDALVDSKDLRVVITRERFEEINMPLFRKTIDLISKTLRQVDLKREDIDDVVLVGGSSRIPIVKDLLRQCFDGKALNESIHPDHAVGYGAAVQAAALNGAEVIGDFQLPNVADVIPMSIGIELQGGVMSVILEKNACIPVTATKTYSTVQDNQTSVEVIVYQGENLKVAKCNDKLGTFILTGIPPAPAKAETIDIIMEVDVMGVLHVEAVCRSTKNSQAITVEESKNRMTEDEKRRIIADNAGSFD